MKRESDISALRIALTLLSNECNKHPLCKKCRLYFNNDCALNRPPAHFEVGEIIAHLTFQEYQLKDDKVIHHDLKE